MSEVKPISMNDFVYLNFSKTQPFRIRLIGPHSYWEHYYHCSKTWVTLRQVPYDEVVGLFQLRLPDDQCRMYECGVPFKE